MHAVQQLYVQNPFWLWLAIGAVFVALDIAAGSGKLIWAGVAAAALAFVNLAEVRLGAPIEFGLFAFVAVGGAVLSSISWKGRASSAVPSERPATAKPVKQTRAERAEAGPAPAMDGERTGKLVGRIGRTTSEFSNGVGRVFIDGTEWGAELHGQEDLPSDTPVRILGVTGGVRLHVRNLMMG